MPMFHSPVRDKKEPTLDKVVFVVVHIVGQLSPSLVAEVLDASPRSLVLIEVVTVLAVCRPPVVASLPDFVDRQPREGVRDQIQLFVAIAILVIDGDHGILSVDIKLDCLYVGIDREVPLNNSLEAGRSCLYLDSVGTVL